MSDAGGNLSNGELAARLRECLIEVERHAGKGAKLQDRLSLLRDYLADSIPEAEAAREALLGAVECGVADILRENGGSSSLERGHCAEQLVKERCLSEEWAERVVSIWIEALGDKSCDVAILSASGGGGSYSPVGEAANTGVNSETPSAQTIATLATLAPRDALRRLFAAFPDIVKDGGRFSGVAKILFAQDVKRCTRYLVAQRSGVLLRLVGQSRVSAGDWKRVISDLVEFSGFSHEVCVECASEWAYALNVMLPEDALIATLPSLERGRVRRAAGECLSLALPGNVAMEFVWCPPDTFVMGSPKSELGHHPFEIQHVVTLSHGFWMARYPTTQLQYKALIGSKPSVFSGNDCPVEHVSWYEAVAFCEEMNERLGSVLPEGFRCALPTEAQWEYACRAGTTSALNSGREITSEFGICPNVDAVAWYEKNSRYTDSVGQRQGNAWGLYDMHGLVGELCREFMDAYPTHPVTDPIGPEDLDEHVCMYGFRCIVRGGSFESAPTGCRSAYRLNGIPRRDRSYDVGFRPVLAR